jgi:threonine/homoserine/homoserine lactone efflux protein
VVSFLLKGLILGFSIAAPVGPIGVLCIRRTLAEGKTSGFVSGLGAATADAVYGFIAAFGLATIAAFLLSYQRPIRVAGGLFLPYLAAKIFFSRPTREPVNAEAGVSLWNSYASTAFLTLTNPVTILSFIAVFSALGLLGGHNGYFGAGSIVFGVFLGSTLWWLILSTGTAFFGRNLDAQKLRWVNRIAGSIIASLGLWSLLGS